MANIINFPNVRKALALAEQGLPVFACDNNKSPLTPHSFKDATTNTDIICRWWKRWPDALIGVPTGEKFCIVDCDLQHVEAQVWYGEHCRRLPLTRKHTTRSGGRHLLFQPHDAVKCTTSKIHRNIDTRGLGGYVIWWPSHGYEVLHANCLEPVPDFILDALAPRRESISFRPIIYESPAQTARQLEGILVTIARAQEGNRDSALFWAGHRLAELTGAGMLSRATAIALGVEAATRCGLGRHEAQRTIENAFR